MPKVSTVVNLELVEIRNAVIEAAKKAIGDRQGPGTAKVEFLVDEKEGEISGALVIFNK